MALEVVGGAVLGAVIGELLKAVIDAKQKTSSFQPSLTRLESTLKSIIPRVDQISHLNYQLNHHPDMEEELVTLINKGKALVLKCSKISTINLVRKLHYSKELQDLDNSLLRYFMTIMPLDHFKDTKEILVAVRELQMKLVGNQSESVAGTSKTGSILQVKEENGDEKLVGDDCLSSKSMVVVPVYRSSISPNGRLRQSIVKSWQKGDLLGSGSVVVDDVSSSWDICRSFSPQDDEYSNLDEEDKNFEEEKEDFFKEIAEREEELDHCLSSMVVPVYSILPNGKFRHSMKSWQKGDFLASWPLGAIYEGYNDDGLFFAVKELSLLDQGSQGQQSIHQLQQEISLLSQFEHENIVQYLGTDKDEGRLYIFLELVTKGSLANLYQKYILRDSQVSAYTRQILNGLKYLHERNVVHGDIKCAHILMNASGSVKLAHFGLAKATKLNDSKGTACWMAPEVVNRKKNGYGLAADIWSLGCTVLEMLTRQIPYSHLEGMEALFRIGKGDPPPVPNSLSRDAQDFIFKCLQANPDNRPTAAQLLEHSFVKRSLGDGDGVDGGL